MTNVKISWPYVFAPDRAYGLYVLDVSDPTDIVEAASCPTPGDAMWLDIAPDHRQVYIADADGGLRIIDISDPLYLREVGFYAGTLEMATHVAVSGDSVYVADGGRIGLHPAGQHSCVSDAESLASGIYFICLQAHGEIDQRKVVLAK